MAAHPPNQGLAAPDSHGWKGVHYGAILVAHGHGVREIRESGTEQVERERERGEGAGGGEGEKWEERERESERGRETGRQEKTRRSNPYTKKK